ncbi:hypothetical protein PR202_ga08252 [Eleusine coracana subsp. coracana]|uniref:[RNA-polymerase]-subunit kinase n=1 Tax=Eleusine coracana subsp. coracana TaxID=191504 RepID=A0AAV5C1Q7_ELECO|nr:hypothetical protein PR202_ga08252 [Eleusine coracana subsp. coracana]
MFAAGRQVYMAKETGTNEIVALKKIRMDNEREGFPITAIREIKILKKLHHKNVIKLKEIVTSPGPERDEQGKPIDGNKYKGSIYMVFEYMDHDLTGLADRPGMRFTVPQIKCYMRQLLTGLHYCHVNQVLHRDIKGSNLLIDNEGNLKLADFGLARSFSSDHNGNLTNRVITLWYRPPELLLGSTKYGPAVDMWSVGCIFAELLNGKPILPGKNEPEQLTKIFELCGTPDDLIWPGVTKMPWYNNFKPPRPLKRRVKEFFKHFDRHALDLLEKMLTLDPSQRISAKDALDAEYFWTDPLPCDPKRYNLMACQSTKHHMNSRQRKNVSNKGKQRKLQSVKKSSTLLHILGCLQSSSQGRHTQSGPARVCTMYHPWGLAQAITMQSPEGQEDLIGTHRVGIKVEGTIRTVEDRVVATVVAHIRSKDEDLLLTLVVVHVVAVAVDMEVAGQISHKVARMVHLVRVEGQTIVKVVLAISNSMKHDFLQNPNLWENGFDKCLGIKRLKVFHPFADTNKFHWNPKLIYNANL